MKPKIVLSILLAATVALILAFTAELFMGTPGLGQKLQVVQAFGLTDQVSALALATGFLGVGIHLLMTYGEKKLLHWHPSQRQAVPL